jgi:rubrerythrin
MLKTDSEDECWRPFYQGKGAASMTVFTPRQEKLLALFKTAIASEKEAQDAYGTMLSFSDDPAIQDVIKVLLSEERQHEERLLKLYNSLRMKEEFKD